MFRIYFVNFGYFSMQEGASLAEAKEIARKAGFESAIYKGSDIVATFSILGGFREV